MAFKAWPSLSHCHQTHNDSHILSQPRGKSERSSAGRAGCIPKELWFLSICIARNLGNVRVNRFPEHEAEQDEM